MENASYPVGTCAERCALSTAVVSGGVWFSFYYFLICVKGASTVLAESKDTREERRGEI